MLQRLIIIPADVGEEEDTPFHTALLQLGC